MKKIILFALAFGIFALTGCNDYPDYYYDPNPSVNETNNDNESKNESPKQETNNDTSESNDENMDSTSQNEEKKKNEPGQLNDDGWNGEIF